MKALPGSPKANTDEVYVGAAYGPVSAKYSYSTSDLFGTFNSKGSTFVELNYAQEIAPKLTLNAQVARQNLRLQPGHEAEGRLLAEERGRGALLAVITHDLDALAPICDHAAVLHRGRIAAEARYAPGSCDGAALLRLYHEAAKSSTDRAAEKRPRQPGPATEQRP